MTNILTPSEVGWGLKKLQIENLEMKFSTFSKFHHNQ